MPIRIFITDATTADCTQAIGLIKGIDADYLLVDKAYNTNVILDVCKEYNIQAVIPAKRNRKEKKREHDTYLYQQRHLVENIFLKLKRWRGIASRYAKNGASFEAAVQIRCLALWAEVL